MDQQHTTPLSPSSDDGDPSVGLGRRDFIRRSAVVGGTLLWAAPTVQSLARPAFGQTAAGTPICGRMTGGGQKIGDAVVNYGFTLYCSTPPPGEPNKLTVGFQYNNGTVTFHLTALTLVTCDSTGDPAPPNADFNRMTGTGTGTLTGATAPSGCGVVTIDFVLIDEGEPGTSDQAKFLIACDGTSLLDVGPGDVDGGNIQAHDATGIAARECV